VIDRIRRLAKLRPDVFGADGHDWSWNPPLPEATVVEFEREHGVRLPEEYRSFITTIANGGAGPFYGVFPFGESDEGSVSRFISVLSQRRGWLPMHVTFQQWYEDWLDKSLRGEDAT
jgi:hypothetical protein